MFINIQYLKHFLIPSYSPLMNSLVSGGANCSCKQSVLTFHLSSVAVVGVYLRKRSHNEERR